MRAQPIQKPEAKPAVVEEKHVHPERLPDVVESQGAPVQQSTEETSDASTDEHPIKEITIDDGQFSPQHATVKIGQTVRWTNNDRKYHQLVGDSIDSDTMHSHSVYEVVFSEEGTYNYHCERHPDMTGKITVKP